MQTLGRDIAREREQRAWELRQRGYTHERIAADLMVDRTTVSKALKRVGTRVLKNLTEEATEEQIAQIGQLRYIVDESMQSWEKSKQTSKALTKRTSKPGGRIGRAGKDGEDVTIATRDQYGNSKYLDTALRALNDLRKLFGVDAPQKLDISENGAVEILVKYADNIPSAE